MSTAAALARVRQAPSLLDAVRAGDRLAAAAASDGRTRTVRLLADAVLERTDDVSAIAAVHALAVVPDTDADALLSDLLSHDLAHLREHAAWALAARLPHLHAIGRLVAAVTAGGFTGMLAQRTLELWAPSAPDHVALALEGALVAGHDRAVRARLVETLGLVPGELAGRAVLRIAADPAEEREGRLAAVAALGDRRGGARSDRAARALVAELAGAGGDLGATARLAALDLGLDAGATGGSRGTGGAVSDARGLGRPAGLTVAQLFLHADLDADLRRAGAGDNGGVATLLVRTGEALAALAGTARVLTLSRGTAAAAADLLAGQRASASAGHLLVPVPIGEQPVAMAQAWPARVAAERGVRRVLDLLGPVDVLHLRMADVGSMVASRVAAERGIPTVFTLAPDPHGVIAGLEATGALTRETFGAADARDHYWFRLRLVARLADAAAHRLLFPRPRLVQELRDLLGEDVTGAGSTVLPEGIDLTVTERARAARAAGDGSDGSDGAGELERLVAALPTARHGLPLLITVGRLHRVKGMATVVEAFAGDESLRDRANLVVVGGDLDDPSLDEREQLDRIDAVLAALPPGAGDGLVLAGHRPHAQVAAWMATARAGSAPRPGGAPALVAPAGAYLCGSLKEEFGLALLEALAAGLVVVAPDGGGPATYVEDGRTGVLVDTRDPRDVARGARAALDLAAAPERPATEARAVAMVRERFTVQAMAATLGTVYGEVSAPGRVGSASGALGPVVAG